VSSRNDHDITSSSSTSSDTNFTDNHVQSLILDERSILWSVSFKHSSWDKVIDLGKTSTIVRTPQPTFDSSSRVDNNFNFVSTSGFKEWSHSQDIETIVISEWNSSSSNVKLKTSSWSKGTIIGRNLTSSVWRPSILWETVRNKHLSISFGSTYSDVEMEKSLDSSSSRSRSGHLPEDILEFLVS